MNRVVFLDRDGVINEDRPDYVKSWEEFRFIRGARAALKKLRLAGIPVVVITNQSVIGRGLVSEEGLAAIHEKMIREIRRAGGDIQKIYFCPHRPEDRCACRKPRIGLLKKAAREMNLDLTKCLFVGDSLKDIQAGNRAGCPTLLVQTGQGKETLRKMLSGETTIKPFWVCPDLPAAVPVIINLMEKASARPVKG